MSQNQQQTHPQGNEGPKQPSWVINLITYLILFFVGNGTIAIGLTKVIPNIYILFAIFILYNFGLSLWGLLIGIFGKAIDDSIKDISDSIRFRARMWRDRTFRNYYKKLRYDCHHIESPTSSTGMTDPIELEEIFIETYFVKKRFDEAVLDIGPVVSVKDAKKIQDYFSPRSKDKHLVIFGVPGSGKSTLLKYLALQIMQPQKPKFLREFSFPILLILRKHKDAILSDPQYNLEQALCADMNSSNKKFESRWFLKYLDSKKCLIMLDGLDEIADEREKRQVFDWIGRQMSNYGENRFIITLRPYGYNNIQFHATTIEMQPFSVEQIKDFRNKWSKLDQRTIPTLFNRLLKRRDSTTNKNTDFDPAFYRPADHLHPPGPHFKEIFSDNQPLFLQFAQNPLLMTIMSILYGPRYDSQTKVPKKRVELYENICSFFLKQNFERRNEETSEGKLQDLKEMFESLAYWMTNQEKHTFILDDQEAKNIVESYLSLNSTENIKKHFEKLIRDTDGLIRPEKDGSYRFFHRTFREYFAAVCIKEQKTISAHDLSTHIDNQWWHETIRFYCALEGADTTPIILACLESDPINRDRRFNRLVLALECQDEANTIKPEVREKLKETIENAMKGSDPYARQIVAEAVLKRRLRTMKHLENTDNYYIDTSFITNAEYQLFVEQYTNHSPLHWNGSTFPKEDWEKPVLGVSYTNAKAFCVWLTDRYKLEPWDYRLPDKDYLPPNERISATEDCSYWSKSSSDKPELRWLSGDRAKVIQANIITFIENACQNTGIREDQFSATERESFAQHIPDLEEIRSYINNIDYNNLKARRNANLSDAGKQIENLEKMLQNMNIHSKLQQACNVARESTTKLMHGRRGQNQQRQDEDFKPENTRKLENARKNIIKVYLSLYLLNERKKNKFPPYEGILLVKERRDPLKVVKKGEGN